MTEVKTREIPAAVALTAGAEARIADAQEAMLRRMTEVGGLQLDLSAHKADKRASWTWDMCDKAARRLEQH